MTLAGEIQAGTDGTPFRIGKRTLTLALKVGSFASTTALGLPDVGSPRQNLALAIPANSELGSFRGFVQLSVAMVVRRIETGQSI
jgi:hypothetical protein